MSSLVRIFLPALLAGAALAACGKQETSAADDAYDHVNKVCQASDRFSCVAAVSSVAPKFIDLLKVDAARKQNLTQSCTFSPVSERSSVFGWGDFNLAIKMKAAVDCLDQVSAAVPEGDKNLKLNVELTKLTVMSSMKGERRLRV